MDPLRIILAFVMLAGAYVLAIAVIVLNVGIATAPILLGLLWPTSLIALPVVVGPLAVISITNVLAIGIAVVAASKRTAEPWPSVRIAAGDAPELTALIAEIAAKSRAPIPAELRLVTEANAAVSENPRIFGFGHVTRRLYLGLPILMGMSMSQLKAILGHEIGHYAGGHSRFGATVHRGALSLAAICAVLRMLQVGDPDRSRGTVRKIIWAIQREYVALDRAIFTGYAWLYNRLFFYVRRAQEFEADHTAAQVVGGAALADALRRAYAVSAAWSDFQSRFLRPMRSVRCVPDDPFAAFGLMLADADYEPALRAWEASPPEQPAAPLDSHPCLADRLLRLSGIADADGEAVRGPAAAVLPALPDRPWIPQLTETMSGTAKLDYLPWDECVNRLGQSRAAPLAEGLLRAAAAVSPVGAGDAPDAAAPTLGHVLDLVQTRRGELAAAVAGPAAGPGAGADAGTGRTSREDLLWPLAAALRALLSCVMVTTGRVHWQVTWRAGGDPLRLAVSDVADAGAERIGDRVNSFVADPSAANADSITLHLMSLGIDPNAPAELARAPLAVRGSGSATSGGALAAGGTVVIHPALDPRRDRLQPVIRGVAVVAVLATTIMSTIAKNHATSPQFPVAGPAPYYQQPTVTLPSYGLLPSDPVPSLRPYPGFTLDPIPTSIPILVQLPGTVSACPVPGAGALCVVITVQSGNTLSLLACRYRTSVTKLQELNNLGTATVIKAGQQLLVPDPKNGPAACG